MLNRFARAFATRVFTPVAHLLLRLGAGPDLVTAVGTVGVCVSALVLYPRGHLLWGSLAVAVFALSDTVDGIMARASGRSGAWGAFLDSTLDRFADAAVFGGLVIWYARGGEHQPTAGLALLCLCLGSIVPYARARAEGLGMRADVGIAERSDRLLAVLAGAAAVGLGAPRVVLTVVLALLAVASLVTIGQRMALVRRQALAGPPAA
ncbi:CDP-alcohol phosphatidyltransferase family protein [Kineococcus sp. R8]|uniref:phosphatidylinositol phosphate synthase n=1 Tax=Kineococcus siccus TaxID=2696567 RepID=UPI0014124A1C|nr:CDP-alcohol phosphatidyltransferase family protein [Kineococcus siccus]NAZ82126.1 CDP-alcohol phosphatidyltransferase family protein [Kineococcus siccus]